MDSKNKRTPRLRRNRWIGAALFLVLVAASWGYYEYCMRSPIPAAPESAQERKAMTAKESRKSETLATRSNKGAVDGEEASEAAKPHDRKCPQQSGHTTEAEGLHIREGLELPFCEEDEFIIRNENGRYTLLYDTLYRQAAWVAYILTRNDAAPGDAKRADKFAADPRVVVRNWPAAMPAHYKGTGYDRGHLCPSADRTGTQAGNDCTFYLSNIAPQTPALNRGPWKQLEEQVREWAIRHDSLYVVTGGVLAEGLDTIAGGIGIPEYFYKAVLTRSGGEFHAIGFLMPNTQHFKGGYKSYAVPVDSLETVTSIDFFYTLPDETERKAESAYSADFWFGEAL